ncbi:MAG: type II secretion system protein [Vampirovibrio sp.]
MKSPQHPAYSLIEIGIALAILGLLTAFVLVSFQRTYEDRDALGLQGALLIFQNVLIEGSDRLNQSPKDVNLASVVEAIEASEKIQWTPPATPTPEDPEVTVKVRVTSNQSFDNARGVRFRVNDCGDVCPLELFGFAYYTLKSNETIQCSADPVATTCNYIANQ